jgi:hypothetical protein
MKTFNQFISEAGAAPSHRPTIDRFFAAGGASISKQSPRQQKRDNEAKAKANADRNARGLPQGTSPEVSRAHIAAQLAALKAEENRKPKEQPSAVQSRTQVNTIKSKDEKSIVPQSNQVEPKQLEFEYKDPNDLEKSLNLKGKMIPKVSKLPKVQKAKSTKTPKPLQLKIPKLKSTRRSKNKKV